MNRSTLAVSLAALSLSSVAVAQTMRASCDNRQGTTFADVVDSSDATQNGYNIDPSENFRMFNALSYPSVQNAGANMSSANLLVNSRFLGADPATRTTGFISECSGNASIVRVSTNVQARSQNIIDVCMTLSGASGASPSMWRLVTSTVTGAGFPTNSVARLEGPSGLLMSIAGNGAQNRVVRLIANGEYRIHAEFDTGMLSLTSGGNALSRSGSTKASLVCVADYNASGTITVQDIFDFLTAWFAADSSADSNASATVTVQDVFDFLSVWFSGCV